MNRAIHFNHQPGVATIKVDDKPIYGMLAAKSVSFDLFVAQPVPKQLFSHGRILAHVASAQLYIIMYCAVCLCGYPALAFDHKNLPHPGPFPVSTGKGDFVTESGFAPQKFAIAG